MQRTWLESAKRPLDVNFDIKSFRTQVKDKIKPCNSMTSDMGYSKYSSAKKETLQSAPSFENLQARIRDFSYSRLGNVASQRTQQNTYSPYKIQGLQQKITDSIGPRNLAVKTFQSTSPLKNYKSFQMNQDRFDIPSAKQKAKRNLVDVVQLNEVVSLRNKIESSYVQRSSLTSTYVSELIRLAQVITSSLKQD